MKSIDKKTAYLYVALLCGITALSTVSIAYAKSRDDFPEKWRDLVVSTCIAASDLKLFNDCVAATWRMSIYTNFNALDSDFVASAIKSHTLAGYSTGDPQRACRKDMENINYFILNLKEHDVQVPYQPKNCNDLADLFFMIAGKLPEYASCQENMVGRPASSYCIDAPRKIDQLTRLWSYLTGTTDLSRIPGIDYIDGKARITSRRVVLIEWIPSEIKKLY